MIKIDSVNEALRQFKLRFGWRFMVAESIDDIKKGNFYTEKHIKELLSEVWQSAYQSGREEVAKKYKPLLNDIYATGWLRDKYGLSDNDVLDAGEIEELLQTFINDHAKAKYNLSEKVEGD